MNKQNSFMSALQSVGGTLSRRRKARYVYLAAFFLPILVMELMWAIHAVAPFGTKMILAHDQWHQYYPFYLDLRRRILSGESLLHSWTTGMGTNYLPLFAYYLASPLNYLAALLPESLALPYYTFTVLLRIGLAGLFFAYFLRKYFDRSEMMIAVFSTMYALCAFLMGYYWNAIWLDTVALLPLVVLGTQSLLRERRYVLYTVSLFLSVFCSYYIGFFVCIFVLLIFIIWHIVNWDDLGGFWSRFFRIGLFTLLALGMTAVLTVPTFLGMQATSAAVNKFPEATAMNMVNDVKISGQRAVELVTTGKLRGLWDFFGAQLPELSEEREITVGWSGFGAGFRALRLGYVGEFFAALRLPLRGFKTVLSNTGTFTAPTSMEGLPNVFCGFSTLVLALAYLFCKRIPLRERLCSVALLLFFGCSFIFRTLDYIWHGMHFPNMLPYRFSFLWSFVVITMGYRAYCKMGGLRWRRVMLLLIPVGLVTWCVVTSTSSRRIIIATLLVAMYTMAILLLYSLRRIRKEHVALGLALCMIAEAVVGAALGVNKVSVTDSVYYPTQGESTAAIVERMKERESDTVDLWRAEVAIRQTLNDGTLMNYNGVSVFSSAANSRVSQFAQSLGMAASVPGNRYLYQQADPFTNMLLGIKYLIDRNGRNIEPAYFEEVDREGDVVLLENQAYLPLGYLVGDSTLDYRSEDVSGLPYDRLNKLFREMTGIERVVFEPLKLKSIKTLGDVESTYQTDSTFGAKTSDGSEDNCVEVTVKMPRDGHLCIYSKSTNAADLIYYCNGERQFTYSDKYGYNRYMGYFRKGDKISLRYLPNKGTTYSATVGAAIFHDEVFDMGYEALSKKTMFTNLVSDTRIEGVIRTEEAGLLYTAIPYDNGWELTVDDQPARITPVGNAMIAFHLEPGVHTIELEYVAPGFAVGLQISLICLGVFLILLFLALLGRFTRPPVVKVPLHLADPRTEQPEAPDGDDSAEPDPQESGEDPPEPEETPEEKTDRTAPTTTMPPLELEKPAAESPAGNEPGEQAAPETSDGPTKEIYSLEELDRLLHTEKPDRSEGEAE